MLKIRFSRVGKRNHAQYRLVLAEKSFPVKGKFLEILGNYDPHLKTVNLEEERIKFWIGKGAKCSDSVHNLLVTKGVIMGKKRFMPIKPKKNKKEEEKEAPVSSNKEEENKDSEEKAEEEPKKEPKEDIKEAAKPTEAESKQTTEAPNEEQTEEKKPISADKKQEENKAEENQENQEKQEK